MDAVAKKNHSKDYFQWLPLGGTEMGYCCFRFHSYVMLIKIII